MKVLVACEQFGVVRDSFLARGHNAISCDIEPSRAGGPHHQGDVREVLYDGWDLIIAHPPCRYLSRSGVHLLNKEEGRMEKMKQAAHFFNLFAQVDCPRVCIENPIPHGYATAIIGMYSQIIHPYQFGHKEAKSTALWLRGLPKLVPTNTVRPATFVCGCGNKIPVVNGSASCSHCNNTQRHLGRMIWDNQTPSGQNKLDPSPTRSIERAKTYKGIAKAMADQFTTQEMRLF